MSVHSEVPRYMEQLLDELGWNKGTRIPLANAENQALETLLINRQNEIQQLKEALTIQGQKQKDLNKYKENVHTEFQENVNLLLANKQQLEQEVKLHQYTVNEVECLERDIRHYQKQSKEICERVERFQNNISRMLKKADNLKTEVCGERGALAEWRAAIEKNAHDLSAIEKFNKQDVAKAKALETKRQQLKMEHDRYENRLNQFVCDLNAEERACERVCNQVVEGIAERKAMMKMWASAVENLRQRDTDIRHLREDYKVLDTEINNIVQKCKEMRSFIDRQSADNTVVEREIAGILYKLGQFKLTYQSLIESNLTLQSEDQAMVRDLAGRQKELQDMRIENRNMIEERKRKFVVRNELYEKIRKLTESLEESLDKNKSSEKRAKQLEDMLNDEEKYATLLTRNQQRATHCSFLEQQKLNALKNEEMLFHMQLKASHASIAKLDSKKVALEKFLQSQKEGLYQICYAVESTGARILDLEGRLAEKQFSAEILEKENRLKEVIARHQGRITILERHLMQLQADMRRLTKELELKGDEHSKLVNGLKCGMIYLDSCNKDLKSLREQWRAERVEEAMTKLRVAHAERALAGLDDTAFTLEVQRLQLDAAMNERLVEIATRRDIFNVQKRALLQQCGELKADIREREMRILQLIKRYDIFIASLGKDDSGKEVTVTFFKIKMAAERAELRERGASLDAELTRRERDVSALEATLRIVGAAHNHFMHNVMPLQDNTPEVEELDRLTKKYYELRDELKIIKADSDALEALVNELATKFTMLTDKNKQLSARQNEAESELDSVRERAARQEVKLENAKDIVRHYTKRAKKLFDTLDDWRIFQMAIWLRDFDEAAQNAIHILSEFANMAPEAYKEFAVLVAASDIQRYVAKHQRRLANILTRIENTAVTSKHLSHLEPQPTESVFSSSIASTHSGVSVASGYMRRLTVFRKDLAEKVDEPAMITEIPAAAARSPVSLNIVTLGLACHTPAKSVMTTKALKRPS